MSFLPVQKSHSGKFAAADRTVNAFLVCVFLCRPLAGSFRVSDLYSDSGFLGEGEVSRPMKRGSCHLRILWNREAFVGQIGGTVLVTSRSCAFPWVVICAAKLLDLLHPTRLLTGGL